MIRSRSKALLAAATASILAIAWMSPAEADTYPVTTSCSNPYTGSQAGPTSFDVQIPATVVVGQAAAVTVSFAFTNSSGFDITDLNGFSQAIAVTTGTEQSLITVTAGSQGAVPNGSSHTVVETGTWTPDLDGTATLTLGAFSFNTVAFGLTIPVSCTFTSAAPSLSSVVSPASTPTPTDTPTPTPTDTPTPTPTPTPTDTPTPTPTPTPTETTPPPDTTAPTGSFTLSPTSLWIGQHATFTQLDVADNGVADPASVTRVVSWGDGTSTTLTAGEAPVTKTYAKTGTFTVTFTLTDAAGNQTVTSSKVTVVNPGHFKLSKTSVWHHETFKVTISSVPAGTTKIVLSYGDGYSSTLKGKSQTVAHHYHYRSNGKLMPAGPVALTAVYTNKYGATVPLAVGKVTIKKDSWKPKVGITKPKHPERVKSWSTIHGTATDKGSGIQGVAVAVTLTVGHTTYCYTAKRTWLKLSAGSDYGQCVIEVQASKAKWSLSLKGLKKGTLTVSAVSGDWADQTSNVAKVTQKLTK